MFGIRLGYYSEDPELAYQIDSLCDFAEDLTPKFEAYVLPFLLQGKLGNARTWQTDFWDRHIEVIEERLFQHGKKFIVGTERPTIADFKMFAPVSLALKVNSASVVPTDIQEQVMSKIEANPYYFRWVDCMTRELSYYLQERPPCPF
mmetsp:Transcript_13831/g.17528  ORF Transcript_13831/g.17528 Transcript_13831/m.17528 type:complete len:147 (-) Transcript_13831:35-475(-)